MAESVRSLTSFVSHGADGSGGSVTGRVEDLNRYQVFGERLQISQNIRLERHLLTFRHRLAVLTKGFVMEEGVKRHSLWGRDPWVWSLFQRLTSAHVFCTLFCSPGTRRELCSDSEAPTEDGSSNYSYWSPTRCSAFRPELIAGETESDG